jgi:hypothetical protein
MTTSVLQVTTTVLPGHRIEICVPELPEGKLATVHILVQGESPAKRPLREVLGDYRGGQLFKTAAEVDAYLQAERDSWE